MDWIRRMFGYQPPDMRLDGNVYGNPTWEEIFDNRNFSDRPESQEGGPFYKDFHMGGTYSFSTGDYEDSFSSMFGQMDEMFQQLDSIMQNFHGHPGGHVIITEEPDIGPNPEAQSPRDSLLKKPDDKTPKGGGPSPHRIVPHHPSPFRGFGTPDTDPEGHFGEDGRGGFREFGGGGMRDPFDMMEDFFRGFGGAFRMMTPFGNMPGAPMLPNPDAEPNKNPRDDLVKKEDIDLDDKITGGFSDLLKDMPKYDPPVIPGQPGVSQPEATQPQPHFQQRYHSTSIVRIRRPDGSVEETRKYTDSTGREEITVTCSEPEDGHPPGSLLRQDDQGIMDGQNRTGHFLPSIFSWFSTR